MRKAKRKNVNIILVLLIVTFGILFNSECTFAAEASLTGNSVVRSGDDITVNLYISSPGSYGIECDLKYDSNVVALNGVQSAINGWKVEMNGSKLIAYDDNLSNPLSGSRAVVTASFKVKSVAPGTDIKIFANNVIATDGTNSISIGNAVYNVKVAEPLSTDNNLKNLSVEGFNIDFSMNKNTYDIGEVEFDVSSINISAVANDGKASVSVGNTSLSVGDNNILINVKAQNGATKTYTIKVKRKQDPNYVASNNANLSSLTTNIGIISPLFSKDVTEYVVYLPFESKTISIEGAAEDSKAQEVVNAKNDNLLEGENKLTVVVVAEDGSRKEYNIKVVVMPQYSGKLPEISGEDEKNPSEDITIETPMDKENVETTANNTLEGKTDDKDGTNNTKNGVPILLTIFLVLIGTAVSFFTSYYICSKKRKKNE